MIKKNYNLSNNNSFSISAKAENFYEFNNTQELSEVYKKVQHEKFFILGDGNNVLFINNPQHVIHSNITYIREITDTDSDVIIEVGSGTIWDDFVTYCVDKNYYGVENLTAIPSSVGATAVQNIGAYGVEAKDIIESVEVFDTFYSNIVSLKNADCEFGYRNSIFKQTDRYIIVSVTYRLSKEKNIQTEYKDLKAVLDTIPLENLNAKLVSNTIQEIRDSKLPSVDKIGNAGSFFKNPVITKAEFDAIKERFPALNGFEGNDGIKISAAFLIEKAGLKGYRKGDAGVYDKHSLILVNHGNATGQDILSIADTVIKKVQSEFDITLTPEVEIVWYLSNSYFFFHFCSLLPMQQTLKM